MFQKQESSLQGVMIIPVIVMFGLIVSAGVAIVAFSGSRHAASTLAVSTPLTGGDVVLQYTQNIATLRSSIAESKESSAAMIQRVQDVFFSVRVPATGLDKHLHAVIAVKHLGDTTPPPSDSVTRRELLAIIDALIHS